MTIETDELGNFVLDENEHLKFNMLWSDLNSEQSQTRPKCYPETILPSIINEIKELIKEEINRQLPIKEKKDINILDIFWSIIQIYDFASKMV